MDEHEHERECFFCSRPVFPPGFYWIGPWHTVVMHPECAPELAIRMMSDMYQIERTRKCYITSRTIADLRERLMREEQEA